jgi:signal peptidase I
MTKAAKFIEKLNIAISVAVLVTCAGAFLLFGWSGSGWQALTVPTGSMRPGMPPGSLAFVHSVPISTLKIGDVITYTNPHNPKTTISHRIIKESRIGSLPVFTTKGDANKFNDPEIVGGLVKGRVVFHLPEVGWWLLDLKKPIVILPIVYVASLLICIEETQRLSEYYKSKIPYRLAGYSGSYRQMPERSLAKLYSGVGLFAVTLASFSYFGPTALAQLRSNTVSLAHNTISVAATSSPKQCSESTNNNTSITVTSTNTQSTTTGSVSSAGGSASSGSASNNSSTTVNINVTNC